MALQRIMPGWVPDMSACDSLENGVILPYNRVRAKADELDALMSKAREQTLFLYLNSVQNKPPFLLVIKRLGVESLSSHNYLRLHFLMLFV